MAAKKRIALYPGSFDPITNGHLDVVRRAVRLFDELLVAVGQNNEKNPVFTVAERLAQLEKTCGDIPGVRIISFSGLLYEAVKKHRAVAVIRGLRAVSDFEWEFQMALMNRELEPACETIFLMPSPEYSFVSSTMIKDIAKFHGDISHFVPPIVATDLHRKFTTK